MSAPTEATTTTTSNTNTNHTEDHAPNHTSSSSSSSTTTTNQSSQQSLNANNSPPTHARPIVHSTKQLDNDIDGSKTENIQDPQKLLAQRFARLGINKADKQQEKKQEAEEEEEEEDDEDEDDEEDGDDSKTKNKNRKDILLVEDVRVSQRVARVALTRAKYRVDTVGTGQEALRKVARKKYGMILMDINLGEAQMDGCEATSKIREYERAHNRPRSVIFGLTGSVSGDDIEKYRQHEMDGVIAKGNILISAVQEALDHHDKNPNEFVISRLEVAKK